MRSRSQALTIEEVRARCEASKQNRQSLRLARVLLYRVPQFHQVLAA